MPIEDFLNPVDEEEIQVELSDRQIVELVQEPDLTEPTEQSEEIIMSSPYLSLPIKAQICVFAQAIALIENSTEGWWGDEKENTIANLRRMQRDCRRRLWSEEQLTFRQTSIMDYFGDCSSVQRAI